MEKRERVILYSDLNNFFASVETLLNPQLKGKPLIVCGDPKERRGIVLAKNEEAKKYGIKTAETVVSALKKCPHVLRTPTHFDEYKKYSLLVKRIYERFTDVVEECSIDECALDVTASVNLFGSGEEIAQKIRQSVKDELGLTVSVGVSFNKIYAKLASDMKKPDAVTVISKADYRKIVYPLPVTDLLFVGGSTAKTLSSYGVKTIGDLANVDQNWIEQTLGKRGRLLRIYARGEDDEPVRAEKDKEDLKSIGNSTTLPKDVTSREEIKRWFYVLSESVAARLRDADVGRANTVHIAVKDEHLQTFTWQVKVTPTRLCGDIAQAAYALFCQRVPLGMPVHLLGVSVSGFDHDVRQMTLDICQPHGQERSYEKKERVESAIAKIRDKYGYSTLQRGVVLEDEKLSGLDIRGKKHTKTPSGDTYGGENEKAQDSTQPKDE